MLFQSLLSLRWRVFPSVAQIQTHSAKGCYLLQNALVARGCAADLLILCPDRRNYFHRVLYIIHIRVLIHMEPTRQSVMFPMDYSFGKPICAAGHLRTGDASFFYLRFWGCTPLAPWRTGKRQSRCSSGCVRQTGHSELDDGDVIDRGKNDSGHACHLFPLSCNPSSLELRENRRPTYKSDGAKR